MQELGEHEEEYVPKWESVTKWPVPFVTKKKGVKK